MPSRARSEESPADGGQAAVELALVLPVVVLLVLTVLQVLVVGGEQVAVHHAAREAARAAAIAEETDPVAAGVAAGRRAAPTLAPARLTVTVRVAASEVEATVTYRATVLPLVDRLLGSPELQARAVMRREP